MGRAYSVEPDCVDMNGSLRRGIQGDSRKLQRFASPSVDYNGLDASVEFTEELQPGAAPREVSDGVTNAQAYPFLNCLRVQ